MSDEPKLLNVIRPEVDNKFDAKLAKSAIKDIVYRDLEGKVYDHMYALDWTKSLTHKIHDKMKEFNLERYKFAVQVIIGENRGQGEKYVSGCLWDEDTDDKAVILLVEDTMYCVAVVFAVYSYLFE